MVGVGLKRIKMFKINKLSAFTLAEVLITLAIIGVVAALTIPALMNSTNDKELKTAWKKSFSATSQVVERIEADQGGSLTGVFTSPSGARDVFGQYMNFTKTCDSATVFGSCWHADNASKKLNGQVYGTTGFESQSAGAVTADGMLYWFYWDAVYACNPSTPRCLGVTIDVNGFKKPNTVGKDIFSAYVQSDTLLPAGATGTEPFTGSDYACDPTKTGDACAAEYLYK